MKNSVRLIGLTVACILPVCTIAFAGTGWPSRDPKLDVLPGFQNPPPGYGQVPFWWWTGDTPDPERMIAQLNELHREGISGVQVNYSSLDTRGWPTDQDEPYIFTDEWWEVYAKVSEACGQMDMGIGLSTYTLDWPNGASLFSKLFYSKPELNGMELRGRALKRLRGGESLSARVDAGLVGVRAYPIAHGTAQRGGMDLAPMVKDGVLQWTASEGDWEVWAFRAIRKADTVNPLMAGSGDTIIQGFYQQFENHNGGRGAKGLNYFFNDELKLRAGKFAWNPDFTVEFAKRKGYDLMEVLPAMWCDMGAITPKVRMDYADVRMSLMEERYFKPIYDWHASRGMIFGCDSPGRGQKPDEFGDYFRATRWYTAPGHDTPHGNANLLKGKVSSSIANLYQRPRVWLEGYHSLGWGATPERIMFATRENYLYGCTLLNLHGLYYSTYGSYWEWAPPCFHFRMPYWAHMGTFLRYFDRLSYLLSQGYMVCDVAVVYPVAPFEAEMNGAEATKVAFDVGARLFRAGINFEFIDNDSLARAVVENGRLAVKDAGASYQALVIPNMEAVRWPTIEKAAAFATAGGKVYNIGALPRASDRAGSDDAELAALVERAFAPACRLVGAEEVVQAIRSAFVQDIQGQGTTVRALHRKAGPRDIYMVMDAAPGSEVEFRAKGAVELWDPWTGRTRPLRVTKETATGTQVELPLESYEAQVVVFTPGKPHSNPAPKDARPLKEIELPSEWSVAFVPTMDNAYGDFRLPVTSENKMIGLEARRFAWARETEALAKTAMAPATDDQAWARQLHGFGPQFYLLGPLPDGLDTAALEAELATLDSVDPAKPVTIKGKNYVWKPYEFSWRMGKEDDPGHQGYHGLKRTVTDDFLCLGKPTEKRTEILYEPEDAGQTYYLWSSVTVAEPVSARVDVSREAPADRSHNSPVIIPALLMVNGKRVADLAQPVALKAGANPVLVRYDHAGRGHLVFRKQGLEQAQTRTPLAMRWYDDPGVIPFDIRAGKPAAEWFRFVSAPGTTEIRLKAHGKVQAWINGEPMADRGDGRFVATQTAVKASVVALRVMPETGRSGGALIPEPVLVETDGTGVMALGDWSRVGILNNFSGGVRYGTTVTLSAEQLGGRVDLDLGRVVATAEVLVNGKSVAVLVAPPWKTDLTGCLKPGSNTLEVLVYNTLSNHYQTIPSLYRGKPLSGLMGPVRLASDQ